MRHTTTISSMIALVTSPLIIMGCTVTVSDANTGGTSAISGTGGALVTGGTSSTATASGGSATTVGGSGALTSGTVTTGGVTTTGGASSVGGATSTLVITGGSAAVVTGGSAAVVTGGSAAVVTGGSAAVVTGGSAAVVTGGTTATIAACTEATKFSGGDVITDRTLTAACSPYLITDDILVDGNATLTIEPGVTLKFDVGTGLRMGYTGAAKLVAVGTAATPITFTSAVSSPAAGDWTGLALWTNTMGGTTISYANMQYCGASRGACIKGTGVKTGRVTIDHVTVDSVGPGANGIDEDGDSNFTITSCTFKNISSTPTQQYAISVPATSFAGIDSTNAFAGNSMVEITGGTVSTSTTWKNPGTAVAVTSSLYLDGTPAPILAIAAGSVFMFADDTQFRIGYSDGGNLKAIGTATAPVTFTSLDESAAPGAWEGIDVWDKATLENVVVSYAGATQGNVTANAHTTVLDVHNSTLSYSRTYGIGIPCNSQSTVTSQSNTFTGNLIADVGPGPTGATCD